MRWLFMITAFLCELDGSPKAFAIFLMLAVLAFIFNESEMHASKREYDRELESLQRVRSSLPESMRWLARQENGHGQVQGRH